MRRVHFKGITIQEQSAPKSKAVFPYSYSMERFNETNSIIYYKLEEMNEVQG